MLVSPVKLLHRHFVYAHAILIIVFDRKSSDEEFAVSDRMHTWALETLAELTRECFPGGAASDHPIAIAHSAFRL
jgi:hypothetical protein